MNANQLAALWQDLSTDLFHSGLIWQVVVLLACLLGGWAMARALRRAFSAKDVQLRVVRWGVESFSYVLSPIFAYLLLAAARPVLAQWQHVNLLRVALPLCASFALIRLAFYVLRRVFGRGGQAGTVLLLFEKIFATLVWGGMALYMTGLWPEVVGYMEEVEIPMGRHAISLLTILQAGGSVVVTLLLALWAGALLEERLMRLDAVHSSLRVVMARTGRAVLILVAVLLSLYLVGIDLTVLSVFGGALGVGIGLGLQKLVSSYVSGFVILIERSLAIGDMVSVDKFYGKVTHINTRYTVLQGLDGIETVVPNEMLVSSAVQNYSLTNRTLRIATQVAVAYDTDIESLLPALEQVCGACERVLADPPPSALLVKFGADGLELEVGFWITDPENGRLGVISNVNRAIWRLLQEKKIAVPSPQREVRLVNELPNKDLQK
jgi:small-conductance mechanosensitive channel